MLREDYYRAYRAQSARRYREFDPQSMEVLFDLIQTYTMAEACVMNRLHTYGMTLPGMNILSILRQQAPAGCPLHALSQLLLVTRANITGVVDSLVRKGFVTRQDHATDRRVVLAKITREGEKWLDHYLPAHYAMIRQMLSGLNRREKSTLAGLLTKLRHTSCRHPRESGTRSAPAATL